MKRFEMKQIREAVAYSMQGGQALHVHTLNSGHWLFRRYPVIGHYFDQDINRLIYVSRRFGVRVIKVECEGTPKQHIDLCGKPFELACQVCNLTPDAADDGLAAAIEGGYDYVPEGYSVCPSCHHMSLFNDVCQNCGLGETV